MSTIIKEGFVEKFKSGFLSSKWKSVFARLYSDSTLALYNDRGDSRPTENIFIKNVIPYICVGYMTDRMPVRRPSLPPGTAVQRLVGIGLDPRAEKVHWILFPSEQILEEWLNGIMSTLPMPPPNVPPVPIPQNTAFVPPPKYPDQPPPYGQPGLQQQQQPPYYQPPAGYGNAQQLPYPSQQTVVIDRTSAPSGGYGGSSGFGTGLAAGMGGAMVGSLLGYGIGSFFAPHGGWGGWGGWGGGGGYGGGNGFGGGYIQDNDTYVTNNYYTNNDDSSTPAQNSGDYSTPSQNDNTDYGDSGGGGTWDDGGGFDGGFDGGGGDW
uniref:PH domain-containing protein n=1 Tax=Globodera rostochiensis TaxID=31243 RepID=A0A914HMJ1_GLORO